MCMYCDQTKLEDNCITPIMFNVFDVFGGMSLEIFNSLGLDLEDEVEERLYFSGDCILSQKINYCPMCGRKLNED